MIGVFGFCGGGGGGGGFEIVCCYVCVEIDGARLLCACAKPISSKLKTDTNQIEPNQHHNHKTTTNQVEDGVVKKLHLEGGGGLSTSGADTLLGEL
jgi:hypothetical protein